MATSRATAWRWTKRGIWLDRVAPEYGYTSPADLRGETAGLCIEVDDARDHHARAEAAGLTVLSAPVGLPELGAEVVARAAG